MNYAEEQFLFGTVGNGYLCMARKGFTVVAAYGKPSEYVEFHLLCNLVTGIIEVDLAADAYDMTRNYSILIKGAGDANIQYRLLRVLDHL